MPRYMILIMLTIAGGWGIPAHGGSAPQPQIRVALVHNATGITLKAAPFFCSPPPLSTVDQPDDPRLIQQAHVTPTPAGFLVNDNFFTGTHLLCAATTGTLFLNNLPITTMVLVVRSGETPANARLTAIEEIPIERYLLGVIAGEMQAGWPAATLQAQAIAARSYVMARLEEQTDARAPYDVLATVEDQVYRPDFTPPAAIAAAVHATHGTVLMHQHHIVKSYFHSCCGGTTVSPTTIWGTSAAHELRTVRDPYCRRSPHYEWSLQLTEEDLESRLDAAGYIVSRIHGVTAMPVPYGGRVTDVRLQTEGEPFSINSNTFRKIVGYDQLKSTWFTVRHTRHGWLFRGRGFGHGAGLCQWGAKTMGDRGRSAEQILSFYYPGTTIEKHY
ncbi:MAG: SpoIID/LytB domain-containing protein [Deltaproteobacteria bacterium]|nr:SpoIID/LytB domain-containing protein [Deltaproteobacteria bacterium]